MANPEHLAMLKEGKERWNEWRKLNNIFAVDLCDSELNEADLSGFKLYRADFSGAKLFKSNFSEASLMGAIFLNSDLRNAIFYKAILQFTDFSHSNLSGANFNSAKSFNTNFSFVNLSKSDLNGATIRNDNFFYTNLSGTNFKETRLNEALFINVNLAEAINLDCCIHVSPSVLDFRTLGQSVSLPLSFLRGCGLSDTFIEYLPSLLNQPIQFYSCFISYSSKDENFAKRLHADLQNNGVRCWFAPKDIKGGRKLHEQIGEAIRLHEKLLLILSEHSMNSEWVKTEIAKARQREVKEKHQVLFPVALTPFEQIKEWECFDADTGKDSAREIREYYIPDFANWKNHDAYQAAFDRLLKDLKPELERKPES